MRPALISLAAFLLAFSPLPLAAAGRSGAEGNDPLASVLANHGFRRTHLIMAEPELALRAKINSSPASLIVATAAPITVLDRNNLRRFGLTEKPTKMSLSGPAGKTKDHVGFCPVKSLEFSGIDLADFEAGVIDESVLNRTHPSQMHIDGVFGLAQMQKLGAVLDCCHHNLFVNPKGANRGASSSLEAALVGRGFVRVPMRMNRLNHCEVDCRVNNRSIQLTVETAAFTSIIDRGIATSAGLAVGPPFVDSEGVGRSHLGLGHVITKEFLVGSFGTQKTVLAVGDVSFNLLGIDFLSSHDAVIDCGGMNLFLRHRLNG